MFCVLAGAGQKVFEEKWGHWGCNLVEDTGLRFDDQWVVERDWSSESGFDSVWSWPGGN